MKTKRIKTDAVEIPIASAASAEAPELESSARLSFTIDADGNAQWDRMRGSTKEQLKKIFSSPDAAKALGIEQPKGAESVEVFDPQWTGALFDSIGKLESFMASKMYKIPADIAEKSFTFTETEKARLAAPTARVINKYAATWMVQFKDEIALAMLFVTMTAVKLQMATALTNMRGAASPTPAPARPVSTIRVEPSAQDLDAAELENSIREKTQGA